jgi:hypothetical protein
LNAAPLPIVVLFVRSDASLHSFGIGRFGAQALAWIQRSETPALPEIQTNSNQFKPIQTAENFIF